MSDKLEAKIDKLDERLDRIDITLARLTDTVVIHEKRSTTAEAKLDILKVELDRIDDHVKTVNLLYKVVTIVGSGVLALLVAFKKLGFI